MANQVVHTLHHHEGIFWQGNLRFKTRFQQRTFDFLTIKGCLIEKSLGGSTKRNLKQCLLTLSINNLGEIKLFQPGICQSDRELLFLMKYYKEDMFSSQF